MAKVVIPGTMCLGCCHWGPQGTEAGWIPLLEWLIPTQWQSTLALIHQQAQGCAGCWEELAFAQPHLWEQGFFLAIKTSLTPVGVMQEAAGM